MCGMASAPVPLSISMSEQINYELMYRRPGSDTHENITDALDEIFKRLEELEDFDCNPGLTD